MGIRESLMIFCILHTGPVRRKNIYIGLPSVIPVTLARSSVPAGLRSFLEQGPCTHFPEFICNGVMKRVNCSVFVILASMIHEKD